MKNKLLIILTVCSSYALQTQAQNTTTPIMVRIEGGTFFMGSNDSNKVDLAGDEKPIHSITVDSFSIGKFEVTVAEYNAFCKASRQSMPTTPEWGWNDKDPIVNVTFDDANAYCKWLSKTSGKKFRLPTESEWEYAAKGGNKSQAYKYSGSNNLDTVGWSSHNGEWKIHACGEKQPNELGCYDMSGNVWEWCADGYDKYQVTPVNIEVELSSATKRVRRGGCWGSPIVNCRVANRDYDKPESSNTDLGFRVVSSE